MLNARPSLGSPPRRASGQIVPCCVPASSAIGRALELGARWNRGRRVVSKKITIPVGTLLHFPRRHRSYHAVK
jgi:hypothetical protein